MSTEHHLGVSRTARYYTLGDPDAGEVWIVCHGYAQLARYFARSFQPIDDDTRLIVAPEALNRYYFDHAPGQHAADARIGATWMTREDREHEIADYIAYLDRLHEHVAGADRARVVALGFSQGTATVSRWAARGHARIDHVVLWAGGIAADLVPAHGLLRGATLTLAIGNRDEHIPPHRVAAETERLRAGAMDFEVHRYDGGHRIEADPLRDIAEQLRRSPAIGPRL